MQSLAQVNFVSQDIKTMSSRVIADICQTSHDVVLKTVRSLVERGIVSGNETLYTHPQNKQQYPEFLLNFRDSMIVASGYSVELRARIIDRWQYLEAAKIQPPMVELSKIEILQMALESEHRAIELQSRLSITAPKAEALDLISNCDGLFGIREAAKTLKIKQHELTTLLLDRSWMYRDAKKTMQGFSKHIERGYIKHVASKPIADRDGLDHVYTQAKLTAKGIARLAEIITKKGV